ncbi:heme anaerobic degradation radical SAM methyltransferase ChuW/HutW [Alginatibacterium sediminis]|uniref:Heme anaerobic degradation radical SAM methyltransferase ChuW/HutW n=1 Tax=Alginatibacterium sediminis TaxID=2164068 RepID=A0A420EL67_9ALTE|nr:heme anaerobic degradation radical SAM methyltransferase ChuW/HutW [Alginatibacterium sediminis]RKF21462.1 heme anaerobic degradation radical SAM methyltransferase ChuW/HutW [Alginatibacterium sediminis]
MTLDISLTGRHSPEPLLFAFDKKLGPHAGSQNAPPLSGQQAQSVLQQRFTRSGHLGKRVIYIHIPFCRVRCTYCNFFQYASKPEQISHYFKALKTELIARASTAWAQAAPFHAVYVGGGTPTDLNAEQIQELGRLIRQHFPLHNDCEITLEGRVHRFHEREFEAALAGGFNRFSFGVQSFNTKVRRAAKRLDDREVVIKRLQSFVAYDAAPICIDLLLGLPYIDPQIFQQDLEDFTESGAHGVDLYQLIGMQGLPMHQLVEAGKLPAPSTTVEKAKLYAQGHKFLTDGQFRQLSTNHWARDNRERSLYNSYAKTQAEVLPIGAGAGGNISGFSYMQHRDIDTYVSSIEQGQIPSMMVIPAAENAALVCQIKAACDRGVIDLRAIEACASKQLGQHSLALLKAWQKNGLVEPIGQQWVMTLAGQFWSVNLCQALIRHCENYLQRAAA